MRERGLLPDFSPAAIAEANAVAGRAPEAGPSIRDLRGLPWASIDNDDSRDLDQLTVAEPLPGGDVKVLVAVADVSATVESCPRRRAPGPSRSSSWSGAWRTRRRFPTSP